MGDKGHILNQKPLDIFIIKKYNFLKEKKDQHHKTNPWTPHEDSKLRNLVFTQIFRDWKAISTKISGRSEKQCQTRWERVLKPGLKKGKWCEQEDELLREFVTKNGAKNWAILSKTLKWRTPKQIRDRWINNLNPQRIDFTWDDSTDKILLKNFLIYGSKWTKISKFIEGSTENIVKNRFYSLLRATARQNNYFQNELKNPEIENIPDNMTDGDHEIEKYFLIDGILGKENEKKTIKKKNLKNIALSKLMKYLPYLLEKKKINVQNESDNGELIKQELDNCESQETHVVFEDDQSFDKYYQSEKDIIKKTEMKLEGKEESNEIFAKKIMAMTNILEKMDKKSNESCKVKKSILLNLQIDILYKILNRIKVQTATKYFQYFRNKTLIQ